MSNSKVHPRTYIYPIIFGGNPKIRDSFLEEIKSLRILCKNQEKSLKQFESTQSALPRVLTNFEHEKSVLKERLRKTKENEKRLEREKKRADLQNEKFQKRLEEATVIIQAKNLDERWNLQKQLEETVMRAAEAEQRTSELTRHFDLQASGTNQYL
jgi:chromosome segregation ATPase